MLSIMKNKLQKSGLFLVLIFFLTACTPGSPSTGSILEGTEFPIENDEPESSLISPVPDELTTAEEIPQVPSTIFFNGNVLTIEEDTPNAQAIAVHEDMILAVGSNERILALGSESTIRIDLQGRAMLPGFIDSHVHRIGDRAMGGFETAEESIQLAIEQGYTTMNEMFVDEGRLDELRSLDQAGALRLRVNAYLPLNYDQPKFGNWFQAYQPGHEYSPYLRIAGLKIFMDHGWGLEEPVWTQDELDQTMSEASDLGWQFAVHAVGESSHKMLLNSIEQITRADPDRDHRFRIEHVIVISDADVQRMADLDVLASIQLHAPNSWTDFDDFYSGTSPELYPKFARYRDLAEAGVLIIGSSDWPWATVEEGFGSPMKMLNQAVTRVGTDEKPPEEWMVGQEIPVELALRSLTINGAYGVFQEDILGSIKPGKFADLVILSADPLDTPIEAVPDIQVLMTMVGGKVEWCQPGSETICPADSFNQASLTKSNAAALPFGFLDSPAPGQTISGIFHMYGWALDDNGPIERVEVFLDGELIGQAIYGDPRTDVANDYPGREYSPNFGYTFQLDTSLFPNGSHTISVMAFGPDGDQAYLYPEALEFIIQN